MSVWVIINYLKVQTHKPCSNSRVSLPKLARNFLKTKAGAKCPEIGREISKNWVRVNFGRNVQGPKYPLVWCKFGQNVLLVKQSTTTMPIVTNSNMAAS